MESNYYRIKNYLWLLTVLAKREISQKYSSTILGFGWLFFQPVIQMVVYTFLFSTVINLKITNYPLFVLSGLVPWSFFTLSFKNSTDSIITSRDLVKKLAFPRILIPMASTLSQLPVLLFSLSIVSIFALTTSAFLRFDILLICIITLLIFTIGLSLITSSLQVYFRDITFIVDLIVMIWFYITPIVYPLSLVTLKYIGFYSLNPMTGLINGIRFSIGLSPEFIISSLLYPVLVAVLIFILGISIFTKRSKLFADWL